MADILEITALSLQVSTIATLISLLIGLPFGTWLALGDSRGRSFILSVVNTGMALPPVVVGLVVAMTLWRSGPLGDLKLIYTPWAIIIAQTVISAPVVTGLTAAALAALDPRLQQQLLGLGASRLQMIWMLWREARLPLLAALMAGFGSVISEVGASMWKSPYTSGHLMVVPFEHAATLEELDRATRAEMMELTSQCMVTLKKIYRPQGFNVGANIGTAAGAGVPGHVHIHIVPRWGGDTNFMSTLGETRVLPEAIEETYKRVRKGFEDV